MNLKKVISKTQTEDLLLSVTENCEKLILQTHRKAEEIFQFKLTKSKETSHINQFISIERSRLMGLISQEVYKSIFSLKHGNYKLEH